MTAVTQSYRATHNGREMLTEDQAKRVWEKTLGAEVRSLYSGDFAASYTRRKQIITAASLFLSSGAAATVIAQWPGFVPMVLALIVALMRHIRLQ